MSNKKNFVLDTNVLLDDIDCIVDGFGDNNIILPLEVIQELDGLKNNKGNLGFSARAILRSLDEIVGKEVAQEGVERNEEGGLLRIAYLNKHQIDDFKELGYKTDNNDDMIVLTALQVKKEQDKKDSSIPTIFVSNDYAARIKSVTYDIPTEMHKKTKIPGEFLSYNGYRTITKDVCFFGQFDEDDKFEIIELNEELTPSELGIDEDDVIPNEFIHLEANPEDPDYEKLSKNNIKKLKVIYRYKGSREDGIYVKRNLAYKGLYGDIKGKNLEQSCAIDLLMDDDVNVVTIRSPAGGGKTFLSLAVALTKLQDTNTSYEKIIFLKPTVSVADDIGFLPGTAEEKLGPYMASFVDNISTLKKMNNKSFKETSASYEELINEGKIELESISFIRGRSFNDCIIISDENQNVDSGVMKTIMSRVGQNCKIICLGDVDQIDASYLSKDNNGLSHLIQKFKGQDVYGHVSLNKCERSRVSELAAKYL